ncbi:MAG: hypothetical protein KAU38_01350 [Desulfobacterales bacterium]|nr:hypothetical protein [Desulfobacterales bacterium]
MEKGKFVLYHSKQRKGNIVYTYYMIAWYYRRNNKPFRQIIKHLGRLNEEEVEFYDNTVACLNRCLEQHPAQREKQRNRANRR